MKKIIRITYCALFVFLVLSSFPIYGSSKFSNIISSKPIILINGIEKKLNEGLTTFIYNNSTYVPLRFLSENSGNKVDYNAQTKTIAINSLSVNMPIMKSEINIKKSLDQFDLSLYSSKSVYTQNDNLQIWSELEYNGEQEIDIYHGYPILTYYIKNAEGDYYSEWTATMKAKSTFKKNDNYLSHLSTTLIKIYHFEQGTLDSQKPIKDIDLPPLPKGEYIIGVISDFVKVANESDKVNISTELTIKII